MITQFHNAECPTVVCLSWCMGSQVEIAADLETVFPLPVLLWTEATRRSFLGGEELKNWVFLTGRIG